MNAHAPVSLRDIGVYAPPKKIDINWFLEVADAETDGQRNTLMFRAPQFRRHIAPDETAVDMIEKAMQPLVERHGESAVRSVDILITHVQIPDKLFVGCGTEVLRRLGLTPEWAFDLHNGGCAVFVHALKLARSLIQTTSATSALICVAANAGGTMFAQPEVRKLPQAPIPGDGCAVALVVEGDESPILDVECHHFAESAGDMVFDFPPDNRKYWQPGIGQMRVGFTESKIARVLSRGNRLVPEVVHELCRRLGVASCELDVLITNQPNKTFLRNWREALELQPERHPDTFDEYGNLFGAGIPMTLDHAIRAGQIDDGDLVMLAGFAHAGDFAGAAALRWHRAA